jgi:hypothetical protein
LLNYNNMTIKKLIFHIILIYLLIGIIGTLYYNGEFIEIFTWGIDFIRGFRETVN